ncbi:MAG: UDP-N-acetylmuramoyl-tripeptide--D-alanyl-D-alanine ligase [Phycisphaerae bacterium]
MKPLAIAEIRRAIQGVPRSPLPEVSVQGVSIDSRTAQPGDVFFAIKGENCDGHDFLPQAAEAGCIAAVVRRDTQISPDVARLFGCGLLEVDDTTAALGRLGAYHRSIIPATVVAVTGSNGKTTVKRMIHHVLSTRMRGTCSPKSFNNAVGVPLTLLGAGAADDYLVVEIGTNAPGEVAALARMAKPDIAVITGIAEAHLAGLGSLERIAAEKASILGFLEEGGLGIVWSDSEPLNRAAGGYDARLVRFGEAESADIRLTAYEPVAGGCNYEINGSVRASLPLPGRHNAINALAAVAVARRLGMDLSEAAAALADFQPVEMRTERIDAGGVTLINDAYNANPTSMLAAADVLAETDASRRVLIAGDMLELGPDEVNIHTRTGRELAAKGLDLLIGVGKLGRYIATGAGEAGLPAQTFESVTAASRGLAGLLRAGDAVLLKGSRAMRMERLVKPIVRAFAPKRNRKQSKR